MASSSDCLCFVQTEEWTFCGMGAHGERSSIYHESPARSPLGSYIRDADARDPEAALRERDCTRVAVRLTVADDSALPGLEALDSHTCVYIYVRAFIHIIVRVYMHKHCICSASAPALYNLICVCIYVWI